MEKDLSRLKINQITDISAAVKEFKTIGIYESDISHKEDTSWKHSNSAHISTTFHPGSTYPECIMALERFLNGLTFAINLFRGRIVVHGVLLETRQEGNPLFHGHFLVKSPKSRKSGKTIARCRELHASIQEGISDSALKSFVIEPIHDLEGAIAYLTGPRNLCSTSTIKAWKINQ